MMDDTHSMSAQSAQQHQIPMQQTGNHMNTNTQSSQPTSVLNNFDFTAIEDLDPSLGKLTPQLNLSPTHSILTFALPYCIAQGHLVMFDREAPFELRIQDPGQGPQEVGTLEAIRIKVLLLVSASFQQHLKPDIDLLTRLCLIVWSFFEPNNAS